MKVRREKMRLMEERDNQRADRATREAKRMNRMTAKELRSLARLYEVKGRSKAKSKVDLIQLLEANYGDMQRDYHERRRRHLESEAIQRGEPMMDESTRWDQEIQDKERTRQPSEPACPRLTKSALNGSVQKWFMDGSEYNDPNVFLYDIRSGVKETVDNVNGPKKVSTKTGVKETDTFGARSGTHTITVQLGDTYDEMKDKMQESLAKFQRNRSGWRLKSIVGLEIGIVKFNPMEEAGFSKLSAVITKKRAVINMMNKECKEKCGECDQARSRRCVSNGLSPEL